MMTHKGLKDSVNDIVKEDLLENMNWLKILFLQT